MATTEISSERFSRGDYLRLPEGFPAELIDGSFVREPAPTRWHQRTITRLVLRLATAVDPDRVLVAPTDVCIDEWSVLQPDVLVTRPDDPVRPGPHPGGLPLLVVEVLSPSTVRRDRETKTSIYLRAGVPEVWIVDPDAGTIELHTARGVERASADQRLRSAALPEFTLAWSDLARGVAVGTPLT